MGRLLGKTGSPCDQVIYKPAAYKKPCQRWQDTDIGKGLQRLVHHIRPEYDDDRLLDICPYAAREPRWPQLRIGVYRHTRDSDLLAPRLHDRLQRVGVIIDHIDTHRGIPCHRTEPAGCIGYVRIRCHPHCPAAQMLELFLHIGKMLCIIDWAGAHYHVRPAVQYRLDQLLYVLCTVLVVRIRIHNDIRPVPEASVKPCHGIATASPIAL